MNTKHKALFSHALINATRIGWIADRIVAMRTTHQISRESVFLDVGFTKEPAVYVTPFAQKPPTLKN